MSKHLSQEQRRLQHYAVTAAIANANGFDLVEGPEHYVNQDTQFSLRCLPGHEPHGGCPGTCQKSANKITSGQCCSKRGHQAGGAQRKKAWVAVQRVVADHPAGLKLLATEADYRNQDSPLAVACLAHGHQFSASYGQLRRKDSKRSGCPVCGRGWAEGVALVVASAALGTEFIGESTPPWLKDGWQEDRGPLRFDGYTRMAHNGVVLEICLEHQGVQHKDPDHFYHRKSGDPAAAFARLQAADQHKQACCTGTRRLILVDDLTLFKSIDDGVREVLRAIKAALPELPTAPIDAIGDRLLKDDHAELNRRLLETTATKGMLARLKAQAVALCLSIVSYDPAARRIRTAHPEFGVSEWRSCTGKLRPTKKQQGKASSARQRLDETAVIASAEKTGWLPGWQAGEYINQYQLLKWTCATCGHEHIDSYMHKKDRPHADCVKRASDFAEIAGLIAARGDTLLSEQSDFPTSEKAKVRIRCTRDGGCGEIFEQAIEKIRLGQLHGCDKGWRTWVTRKLNRRP